MLSNVLSEPCLVNKIIDGGSCLVETQLASPWYGSPYVILLGELGEVIVLVIPWGGGVGVSYLSTS